MVFTGADYNILQNYKITKFPAFVKSGGEGYGGEVEWGKGLSLSWNIRAGWGLPKLNKCEQWRWGRPNFAYFVRT